MLTQYNLKIPGVVYSGENALGKIPQILKACGAKKVALFTDGGIVSTGLLNLVTPQLDAAGLPWCTLDDTPPEPTYAQAQAQVDRFRESSADFIVAVGGGSVMDAAKLASIAGSGKYSVKDLLSNPSQGVKAVQTLMIPTTSGTGAEATPNAIVAVPEQALKVGIVNECMIADYVILDAEMTRNLPRKIAAATGVDALAHAIECFTSNKANPFSDMFALEALDLILNNIERACDEKDALEEKRNMLLASFYAGIAITCSGTTAVHALSYPLGGKYHIPHGVSNAILLAPVFQFNESVCRERLAVVYDRCFHGGKCASTEDKSAAVVARLEEIVKHLDIPTQLSELGVPATDLEALVSAGMGVTRLLVNNMRPITADDARAIYKKVM